MGEEMNKYKITKVDNGFILKKNGRNGMGFSSSDTLVFLTLQSLLGYLIEELSDKEKKNDQSETKKM